MKEVLNKLIMQFETAPPLAVRGFRDCLSRDPDLFRSEVFKFLALGGDQPVTGYLTALLAQHYLLLPWLVRPEYFTAERAVELSKKLVKYDPTCATTFTHLLSELALNLDREEVPALRILAILGEVSANPSTPLLTRFLNSTNKRIRSKAALLMGRVNRSVHWVDHQLQHHDSRLAANALESLWGVATPEACQLFRKAAHSPVHRLAGNAFVALYRAGQVDSLSLLTDMFSRQDSASQATAAWAAGEAGDSRFLTDLERLSLSTEPAVKRNAKQAITRIHQLTLRLQNAGALDGVAVETTAPDSEVRRARVALVQRMSSGAERPVHSLSPTSFLLRSGDRPELSYAVAECPPAASLAVGVVWPWEPSQDPANTAKWAKTAETLLAQKRQNDYWSVLPYVDTSEVEVLVASTHGAESNGIQKLGLSTEVVTRTVRLDGRITRSPYPSVIASALHANCTRPSCASGSTHALAQLTQALSHVRESAHILLFANPAQEAGDLSVVIEFARQSRIHVHVFVCGDTVPETYLALAAITGGIAVANPDLAALIPRVCRNLSGYYEITWTGKSGPSSVEIRSARGCIEPQILSA